MASSHESRGTIDAVVRSGELLYKEVQRFREMDGNTAELRSVALNIKQGDICLGLDSLRRSQPANDEGGDRLGRTLVDLNASLGAAQRCLSKVDEDPKTGMPKYHSVRSGRKHQLEDIVRELNTSCAVLKDLCQHASKSLRSYLLTPADFQLDHETPEISPRHLLPHSDILVAKARYIRDSQSIDVAVILERKTVEDDVQSVCAALSTAQNARGGGILPPLGYRQPPHNDQDGNDIFDLIFQLPGNATAESLALWISTKPVPPAAVRLKLCLTLSTIVEHVHALHLLHKRIRTRSLLMLVSADNQPFELYLQDWSRVRNISDKTTWVEAGAWEKRIYQHPERQGTFADADYEPRHDIYSLGVCMLEILLWTPFVVEGLDAQDENTHRVCEIFENRGLQLGEQNVGEMNGALPVKYKGDSYRLTSRPWATSAIWKSIARTDIPDQDLAQVILQCLEGELSTAAKVAERLRALIE